MLERIVFLTLLIPALWLTYQGAEWFILSVVGEDNLWWYLPIFFLVCVGCILFDRNNRSGGSK